jgi:hypothetical protein
MGNGISGLQANVGGEPTGPMPLLTRPSMRMAKSGDTKADALIAVPAVPLQPLNFGLRAVPIDGEKASELVFTERLIAVAGTDSAKLLAAELKKALAALTRISKPDTLIHLEISLSGLLGDFALYQQRNNHGGAISKNENAVNSVLIKELKKKTKRAKKS